MANILLAGTPNTSVTVAEALVQAGHTILGVLCPFPKPVGRKQVLTPSALETWAKAHSIPVTNVDRETLRSPFARELPSVDLMVVADFGFLIPAWLLNLPKHGSLNIHPSLLPRWRGATPVPFTLLFGEKETGVTIIKMNERFDEGEIAAQKNLEILDNDTTPTLLQRAFAAGAELLVNTIPEYLAGNITLKKQEKTSPTPYSRRFTKEDGFIPFPALKSAMEGQALHETPPLLEEFRLPNVAGALHNMIRGLTPWPGAWTILPNQKRVKILSAKLDPLNAHEKLTPTFVQIEGKNPTPFSQVKTEG